MLHASAFTICLLFILIGFAAAGWSMLRHTRRSVHWDQTMNPQDHFQWVKGIGTDRSKQGSERLYKHKDSTQTYDYATGNEATKTI